MYIYIYIYIYIYRYIRTVPVRGPPGLCIAVDIRVPRRLPADAGALRAAGRPRPAAAFFFAHVFRIPLKLSWRAPSVFFKGGV